MSKAFMHLKQELFKSIKFYHVMPAHHYYSHFPHLSLTPDLLRLTSVSAELRVTCTDNVPTRVLPVMHLVT